MNPKIWKENIAKHVGWGTQSLFGSRYTRNVEDGADSLMQVLVFPHMLLPIKELQEGTDRAEKDDFLMMLGKKQKQENSKLYPYISLLLSIKKCGVTSYGLFLPSLFKVI